MGNPFLGVFFHWLGGLASGIFYVPYKGVRKWSTILIGLGNKKSANAEDKAKSKVESDAPTATDAANTAPKFRRQVCMA